MSEPLRISDIRNIAQEMAEDILREQRRALSEISAKINRNHSKIIAVIFSQSRKIRQEIGYQTVILKVLEDSLSDIQFDADTGVSSKIEISVGSEVFGTGAKWVVDVDIGNASYGEILEAIQRAPGIPNRVKDLAKSKLRELRN
ncbi:MAG: hypothetical protein WBW48_10920 [Anaerolineae bacterium]